MPLASFVGHPYRYIYADNRGDPASAVSVVLWFFFPDSPVEARFLAQDEKVAAVNRVAEAQHGVKNKTLKWYQVRLLGRLH